MIGDVIGLGIDGNGNIIAKNISIVIKEAQQDYGLTLLPIKYFENHKSTHEDLNNWKKGFSFNKLESIKSNQEFRRDEIIDQIKSKLEEQHNLIIVGESGTS
jgi:hypothetical protein